MQVNNRVGIAISFLPGACQFFQAQGVNAIDRTHYEAGPYQKLCMWVEILVLSATRASGGVAERR